MSWSMCEAHFKKCHATDQTVIFSRTQKGVCVLCGGAGFLVLRRPDLGRRIKKAKWVDLSNPPRVRRAASEARARLIAAGGSEPEAAAIPRRKNGR